MYEELKQRIDELSNQEKQAWANLNYVLGARAECERILASLASAPASEDTPPPLTLTSGT